MAERTAFVEHNTLKTQIKISINLNDTNKAKFDINMPFLEHILDQITHHGLINLDIEYKNNLHINDHHTIENVDITLNQTFAKTVGDKKNITHYGHSYVPLDEALSRMMIDFSNHPGLQMHIPFTRTMIGNFNIDLFQEFFQDFVNHALISLHIDNLYKRNHIVTGKQIGRAHV